MLASQLGGHMFELGVELGVQSSTPRASAVHVLGRSLYIDEHKYQESSRTIVTFEAMIANGFSM